MRLLAQAPAISAPALCAPAAGGPRPPRGRAGSRGGRRTPRFPLTVASTAGVLGPGWASSAFGAWSLGPGSKLEPGQLLLVKSKGWKVLKVGAGALRLPVGAQRPAGASQWGAASPRCPPRPQAEGPGRPPTGDLGDRDGGDRRRNAGVRFLRGGGQSQGGQSGWSGEQHQERALGRQASAGEAGLRAGPSPVPGPLPSPRPPKRRADPVTSVLGAEWTCGPTEGEGVAGAPPSALPALACGDPSPGSGGPGLRGSGGVRVLSPATLFTVHSPGGPVRARGSAMGRRTGPGSGRGAAHSAARQEVSPHPQPGPWRGPRHGKP